MEYADANGQDGLQASSQSVVAASYIEATTVCSATSRGN